MCPCAHAHVRDARATPFLPLARYAALALGACTPARPDHNIDQHYIYYVSILELNLCLVSFALIKQLCCSCSFVHDTAVRLLKMHVHCDGRECRCKLSGTIIIAIVICPHRPKSCNNIIIVAACVTVYDHDLSWNIL